VPTMRKNLVYPGLIALFLMPAATSDIRAQTAGESTLGVTVLELKDIVKGWSARHQILGQHVYNDNNERIGEVEDIIIDPEKSVSYGIVGTGGFLGIGSHDVAIPASQFKMSKDRFVLSGATKEKLRAMPRFEYERK